MQPDRFCRNCGNELEMMDRFCAGCGMTVHETAYIPTPEANVNILPPTQKTQRVQQGPPVKQFGYWWRILLLLGAVVVSSMISATFETLDASGAWSGVAEGIGYFLAFFFAGGAVLAFNYVLVLLILGVIIYMFRRTRGVGSIFWRAVFDWKPVAIAIFFILLAGILSATPFLSGFIAGLTGA